MNTKITGAGLMHLRELSNLQQLGLSGTQVTDAGVAELQEVLPTARRSNPPPLLPPGPDCWPHAAAPASILVASGYANGAAYEYKKEHTTKAREHSYG